MVGVRSFVGCGAEWPMLAIESIPQCDLLPYHHAEKRRDRLPMGKIVVGVDGSHRSLEALEWAARYAEMTGSVLIAITCCEPLNPDMWVPRSPRGQDAFAPTKRKLEHLAREVKKGHPKLILETQVIEGSAAKALEEASQGADLLVVGNRGLGGVSGLLVGSVGMHCVSHAPCPVVVLRAKTVHES